MKQVKGLSFSIDNILERVSHTTTMKQHKKYAQEVDILQDPTPYCVRYVACFTTGQPYQQKWYLHNTTQPAIIAASGVASNEQQQQQQQHNYQKTCNCREDENLIKSSLNQTTTHENYAKSLRARAASDKRTDNALVIEQNNLKARRIGHPYKSRAPPKRKPCRNTFTQSQVLQLEKLFEQTRYLSSAERLRMAKELKMTDNQLKTWYQNRRTKLKRELSEMYEQQRLQQILI